MGAGVSRPAVGGDAGDQRLIGFDRKLWRQDIQGSLAHAAMLAKVGIISAEDEQSIRDV